MDQRGAATKTFYAALTPEQQKLFDAHEMKGHDMRGHGKPMGKHDMPPMPAKY
jgi:Spy/CpxP family protein refolding chaperone